MKKKRSLIDRLKPSSQWPKKREREGEKKFWKNGRERERDMYVLLWRKHVIYIYIYYSNVYICIHCCHIALCCVIEGYAAQRENDDAGG